MSKVTTKLYTSREKRNLKLLSSGCHKISTALSGPYGNRARGRSIQSRNLRRNGRNFRRCQSVAQNAAVAIVRQWHFPLSPRHSIFFSLLCAIVTFPTISSRQKRSVPLTHALCRLSRIKVSHDSSMENTTRVHITRYVYMTNARTRGEIRLLIKCNLIIVFCHLYILLPV